MLDVLGCFLLILIISKLEKWLFQNLTWCSNMLFNKLILTSYDSHLYILTNKSQKCFFLQQIQKHIWRQLWNLIMIRLLSNYLQLPISLSAFICFTSKTEKLLINYRLALSALNIRSILKQKRMNEPQLYFFKNHYL